MKETQLQSLGREEPLEKEMATHSLFLPGEFHGQRSLVGYSLCSHKGSDMTKWLTVSLSFYWQLYTQIWSKEQRAGLEITKQHQIWQLK